MKAILFIVFLLSTNAFGQSNDSATIAKLIIDDYKTFNKWDYMQHQQHCLPHYRLIENGAIMSLTDEVSYFKKNSHRKINRNDTFDFHSIRVQGNIGYAIYKLESTIVEDGKSKFYKWTESAICERTVNGWKLVLIHSTPVR